MKFRNKYTTMNQPMGWGRIRNLAGFLVFFIFLIYPWPGQAATAAKTLYLDDQEGRFELGPCLEILEDKNSAWTITEVSSPAFSNKFKPLTARTLSLGLTTSTIWIRFRVGIRNPAARSFLRNQKWYLDFDRIFLEYCDLFIPVGNDAPARENRWRVIGSSTQGDRSADRPATLPLEFQLPDTFVAPLTLYLRIQHSSALYLPLTIFSSNGFLVHSKKVTFWHGIYFGTIIAMFLFNLFAYAVLRESISLYYLFYIGSVAIYFLFFNGIVFQHMLPDRYRLHQVLHMISLGLTIFWGVYFAKSFLVTKLNSRVINRCLVAVLIAACILIAISPFANLIWLNQVASVLGMISPLLVIIAAAICWKRGFRPIFFFMIAWTILSTAGLIFALTYRGVLPYATLTINSFQIGSGLEVVILSFALAHRIRILRRERARIIDMFGKYVTSEVRDEILNSRIPMDGEIKEVTLLFADLRDFTQLVESSPPKQVVKIINRYFTEMANAIHLHKGLVLQFIGDEIEAVFGAPMTLNDHPSLAVRSALEMRERLDWVNRDLKSRNCPPLRHGIGIHTGQVLAANIGSLDRLSYALVGDSVNVASRIQEQTKKYQTDILISKSTQTALGREFHLDKLELTTLRGKTEPVRLYAIK